MNETIQRSSIALSLSLLSLCGAPATVRAETATDPAQIKPGTRIHAYLTGRPRLEIMFRQSRVIDAALHLQQDCTTDLQVLPKELVLIAPIDLPDGRDAPVAGRWLMRYDVLRCTAVKRYSVVFAARPDGDAVAVAAFPGDSIASPQLLRDTLTAAAASAHPLDSPRDCRSAALADTRVDRRPRPAAKGSNVPGSAWNETWTFDVCGQAVEVPIEFVPTPADGGTDFHIQAQAVHAVPR